MMSDITEFVGCGGVEGHQRANYFAYDATVAAALLATAVCVSGWVLV